MSQPMSKRTQPLLINVALADKIRAASPNGELPYGLAVYPHLNDTIFTECVWLRKLGDFAHVHPISRPCPQKDKRMVAPPGRRPWRQL